MRALLLVILTFGTFIFGSYLEGLHPSVFLQPSALLMVFGPLLIYLCMAVGPTESIHFLKRIAKRAKNAKDQELLDKLCSLGFLFGGVCFVVGIIHVLQNLSDTSKLGAGVAIGLIGLLYGHVPAVISILVSGGSLSPKGVKTRNYMHSTAAATAVLLVAVVFLLGR